MRQNNAPWAYIHAILGSGLHWTRSVQELTDAIKRAELDGQTAAAEHLQIILDTRNKVAFDQ